MWVLNRAWTASGDPGDGNSDGLRMEDNATQSARVNMAPSLKKDVILWHRAGERERQWSGRLWKKPWALEEGNRTVLMGMRV